MKKIILLAFISFFTISCGELGKVLSTTGGVLEALENGISEEEASSGLKQALEFGVNNGTSFLGKTDGFLKNLAYKVLLPEEVRQAEQDIRSIPILGTLAGQQMDKLITSMNRGAENAMAEAKPIFVSAIKGMTIQDAINIVTGGEGAATAYLKRVTSAQLQAKFRPVIKTELDKLNVNDLWTDVSGFYNKASGKNVTTDLNDYVTERAMTALFTEIKKEEDKIRKDPVARTTDLLKKVFGYADTQK
ncbi:MAG: DUF4197 domain-containing protein [Bacteroidia bacterium]